MKNITITRLLDPTKKIQAIKEIRAAAIDSISLREAKGRVDTLTGTGSDARYPGIPTAVTMVVRDPSELTGLDYVVEDEPQGIPRDIAFSFLLDVTALLDKWDNNELRRMPSYADFVSAVRDA